MKEYKKKRIVKNASLPRTSNEAFITSEQKAFLENLLSQSESFDAGKKEIIERWVQNVLNEKDRDKQINDIIILRKYLKTFDSGKRFVEDFNYIFGLK